MKDPDLTLAINVTRNPPSTPWRTTAPNDIQPEALIQRSAVENASQTARMMVKNPMTEAISR